ncbi:hypothetical protein [Brevibacillus laterosporus]|uniref:hypothetical protein n=1 Tax=Brevibacillus TaxID=55080 RepID=UPI001EF348CE|nr:hypothetical protein [Brevibacillus laterosporus]MCG7320223.1 hypothetical protein [Brevibacillus laterosporus]
MHSVKSENPAVLKDIRERVTLWIDGKHGRIGIIAPKEKPTRKEWVELHREIANIIVQSAKRKKEVSE